MEATSAQRAFLVRCSESLILQHGQSTAQREQTADLEEVVLVNLSNLLLKNVNSLGGCKALRICILADNFLTKIDPLVECVQLVKLDLKGNQITHLPSSSFWSNLKHLQLLNLHDNNVVAKKDIAGLSGCPNLSALTLYDTPLSLKVNYRHCVINSIWSLKALDNYVISDEEIIENWHLPSKFKAKCPHFGINLYPQLKPDSYMTEIKVVYGIITNINRIQAIFSPILIIQKWIRGLLTRRRLGLRRTLWPQRRSVIRSTSACIQVSAHPGGTTRRPWVKESQDGQLHQNEADVPVKKLHVNLRGLVHADDQEQLLPDVFSTRSFDSTKLKSLCVPCNTPQQCGILDQTGARHSRSKLHIAALNDLTTAVMGWDSFCLFGLKATMHLSEPFTDMLMSRKADGQDVRYAIDRFHKQKHHPPSSQRARPLHPTAEERLIGQCCGCPSLAPFRVIERAYWAREKANELQGRAEQVARVQALCADGRRRRENFTAARREEVLKQREQEQVELEEALRLSRVEREQEVQRIHQRYARFREERGRRLSERKMVEHFSRQHISLATAIARECNRQKVTHALQERRRHLASSKQNSIAPRLVTQAQLDNRKMLVQTEAVVSQVAMRSLVFPKSAVAAPSAPGQRGVCDS